MMEVRYRSAGRAVVSVTQALSCSGRIPTGYYTPEGCARGILVHTLTEQFDAGTLVTVPSGLHGYLDSYAAAVATCRLVFIASEHEVVSAALGVGGRIDRIVSHMYGRPCPAVLDIKTGAVQAWHGQQLAGYNRLRPTGLRFGLYLDPNGHCARLVPYRDPLDDPKFLDALGFTHRQLPRFDDGDDDQWLIPPHPPT